MRTVSSWRSPGAFGAALFAIPADWRWGLGWGAILWALALLMFSTVGAVHPAIRKGEEPDPGPAGIRLGKMTPIGSLMGHLVYGAILGLGYAAFAGPG